MRQIAILSIVLFTLASCQHETGSGNIIKEKKPVDNFTALSAGSGFEVEVKIGSPVSVEIEADDNLMKYIKVKVEGNMLRIDAKNNFSISNGHFKSYVTVPALEEIESSGAADINVLDEIKSSGKVRLHASGAAKITAKVDAPKVDAESSGAANIEVSGRTKDIYADASGGAVIEADELLSENADAEASGAGSVHISASVKVKAKASGAGNVYYKGGASNVQADESGAGNVHKED